MTTRRPEMQPIEASALGMAILLLLAGYETTANLIGSAALALLQHPDQRVRFVSEPPRDARPRS